MCAQKNEAGSKLLIVAGPSILENEKVVRASAEKLKALAEKYADDLSVYFKGSFDKASRSSFYASRGPGMNGGLELLSMVKDDYSLKTLTDVHETYQVEPASAVCDVVQIPALLCRQTDLLIAAAKSGRAVNVRKGPFLAPDDVFAIIEKLQVSNAADIWLTERGTNFGYSDGVVDMRVFPMLKKTEATLLFDATHTAKVPLASVKKAPQEYAVISALSRAALAAGADGLSLDIHPTPENAQADITSQLSLEKFGELVDECVGLWKYLKR